MNDKWSVRIENSKGEHWDTVSASDEADARQTAAQITGNNVSWVAFVKRNGNEVEKYRRGQPVRPSRPVKASP